jgi:hypothetical protein
VLFSSGYAADAMLRDGDDAIDLIGKRTILRKPFGMQDLAHAVRAALDSPS